jgi:RecB family endonuclease NucS
MSEEIFTFSGEQKANLYDWKRFLQDERFRTWGLQEKEAMKSFHDILHQADFEGGHDLSIDQFDVIFQSLRTLIRNRTLTRNLCNINGLANINLRLRELLFGNKPLAKRIDQFLELKGVRTLTVSQFLCAFDPKQYPEIGAQTLDVLNLDSTQSEIASNQALKEHNITSPEDYFNYTLEYLNGTIVFREIKNLLNIDLYTEVNDILWLAYLSTQQEDQEVVQYTGSVGLEKDLRDHLAANPGIILKGLSTVNKEYKMGEAGTVDILCQDAKGNYFIIETKKGRESDKVVGQTLRYIGALTREGKKSKGIIIVNEPDKRLELAIEPVNDLIKLKYYKVKFELTDHYESEMT